MIESRSIFRNRGGPPLPTDQDFKRFIAAQIAQQEKAIAEGREGWSPFIQKEGADPRFLPLAVIENNPFSAMDVAQFLSDNRTDVFTVAEIRSSPESVEKDPINEAFQLINHSVVATLREAQEMYTKDPDGWAALLRKRITHQLKLDTWPVYLAVFITGRGGYLDWIVGAIRDYISERTGNGVTIPYSIQELERQFREFKSWPERMARSKAFSEGSAFGVFAITSETSDSQKELLTKYKEQGLDPQLVQVALSIEQRGQRMKESAEIVHDMFRIMFNESYTDLVADLEKTKDISSVAYARKRKSLQKKVDTVLAVVHRPDLRVWSEVYSKRLAESTTFDAQLLKKLQHLLEKNYTERSLDVMGFRKSLEGIEMLDFSKDRSLFVDLGGSNSFDVQYFSAESGEVVGFEELYIQLEEQAKQYSAEMRLIGTETPKDANPSLLQRIREAVAPSEGEPKKPISRKEKMEEFLDARKQAMIVWQELFNKGLVTNNR